VAGVTPVKVVHLAGPPVEFLVMEYLEGQTLTARLAEGKLPLAQALKQAHLTASTSEAIRMIEQGGVKLDGERVSDRGLKLARGTVAVAQVGKRKFARITVV